MHDRRRVQASKFGECCNDENRMNVLRACRMVGTDDSRGP